MVVKDNNENIIDAFIESISDKNFPCIGAKAALAKDQVQCMVAGNMACPAHDKCILDYLYSFIDSYRLTGDNFHSAVILFNGPQNITEENLDGFATEKTFKMENCKPGLYMVVYTNEKGKSKLNSIIKL